jgi:DDE family transposase
MDGDLWTPGQAGRDRLAGSSVPDPRRSPPWYPRSRPGSGCSPRYDAGKRVKGRKRHLAVDTGGLLLTVVVTIAGIQDRDGAVRLRAALRAGFSTIVLIWADGGYAGRLVRWAQTVLALTVSFVKRTGDLTGFQVIPAAGSWNAPWPGSASTAAACVTTRPGPSTPRRWSTSP